MYKIKNNLNIPEIPPKWAIKAMACFHLSFQSSLAYSLIWFAAAHEFRTVNFCTILGRCVTGTEDCKKVFSKFLKFINSLKFTLELRLCCECFPASLRAAVDCGISRKCIWNYFLLNLLKSLDRSSSYLINWRVSLNIVNATLSLPGSEEIAAPVNRK